MFQRKNQLLGITSGVEKGVCSQAKPFVSKSVLVLDILPILPHIICPMLRPVNVQVIFLTLIFFMLILYSLAL